MQFRFEDVLTFSVRTLIFLILLTPLVVSESTLFPYVVGKAIYFRILTEAAFALWLVLALRDHRYWLPRSWIVSLFGIYLLVSLAAAITGISFQRSFWGDFRRMRGVFDLFHWFLFLVVLLSMLRTATHWRWLLNTNLAISFVVGLMGVSERYGWKVFGGLFWYLGSTDRVEVTFGNATYVGAYTLVNALIACALLAHSFEAAHRVVGPEIPRRRQQPRPQQSTWLRPIITARLFWIVVIVVNVWVLTLSGTRGAVVGLAAALFLAGVVYALLGTRKRVRITAAGASALLLGMVLFIPMVHNTPVMKRLAETNALLRRVDQTFSVGLTQAYESRRFIVEAGIEAFPHAPLLGFGPENFAVAYDRYGDFYFGSQLADQAHSQPISELTTKGLLGFTAYLALNLATLWLLYRRLRSHPQEEFFTLLLGAAIVGYQVQNLFLFDTPGTFLQFAILLGWVAWTEVARRTPQAETAKAGPVRPSARQRSRRRSSASQVETESQSSWFPYQRLRGEPLAVNVVSLVTVVLALSSIYWTNIRAYSAAASFPATADSLQRFVAEAKESFEKFPPLATLPRSILFDTLAENWQRGGGNLALLEEVREEAQRMIQSEPQNPMVYLSVVRLIHKAADQDPSLLDVSASLIQQVSTLTPNLPPLHEAEKKQAELEARLRDK